MQGPEFPLRVDAWLATQFGKSRREACELIEQGKVLVNGKPVKPSLRVDHTVEIVVIGLNSDPPSDKPIDLLSPPRILFQDDDILVIEKPAGWTAHEVHRNQNGHFVTQWLVQTFPHCFSFLDGIRPGIVHRLDQYTEGLMVIAKHAESLDRLKNQFKARTVEKRYYAAVKGNVLSDEFIIDQPIGRASRGHKMVVTPDGKPAISAVRVLERWQSMTIVEVTPKTGRTHQIRVHLDFVGYPVIGDPVYGKSTQRSGQRLQAYYLGFAHPKTGEWVHHELAMSDRIRHTNY